MSAVVEALATAWWILAPVVALAGLVVATRWFGKAVRRFLSGGERS